MNKLLFSLLLFPSLCIGSVFTSDKDFPGPNQTLVIGSAGKKVYNGVRGLTNAFYYCNNGDTILIGPGTYTLAAYTNGAVLGQNFGTIQTSNKNDISVYGFGSIIKATNYGTIMMHIGISNLYMNGITFDGGGSQSITNHTNASFRIEFALATSANYEVTRRVHNVVIDNCTFANVPDQAISFIYGGAWNATIKNCKFYNIGYSNVWGGGYSGPDGACVSGIASPCYFINNYCSNFVYGFEIDGTSSEVGRTPTGHWVCKDNIFDAINDIGVLFGNSVFTMRGLYIENNLFQFHTNTTHVYHKDGSTWAAVAGIFSYGNVSDVVIRGNTFVGLTNYGAANASISFNDSYGTNRNFLITQNTFQTNSAIGIYLADYLSANKYEYQSIIIKDNFFDSLLLPCQTYVGNTTFEGNTFRDWTQSWYGNTVGAVWLRQTYTTNIIFRNNLFHPTNAACYAFYSLAGDPSVKFHNNEFRGPVTMTAIIGSSWSITNTHLIQSGAGAPPSLAVGCGSLWYRTDHNNVAGVYTKTNNTTTWRYSLVQ